MVGTNDSLDLEGANDLPDSSLVGVDVDASLFAIGYLVGLLLCIGLSSRMVDGVRQDS